MNRVVRVEWQDITGHDRPWWEPSDAGDLKPADITTIGLLVTENPEYLVVAGSWENDGGLLGNVNCIPRGVVRSLETLGNAVLASPNDHP